MNPEDKDRIAELLKKKLCELKERDGDLSRFRAVKRKKPEAASEGGRNFRVFGDFFDPAARLESVFDRNAGAGPGAEIERWLRRYPGRDISGILERELGPVTECGGPDLLQVDRPTDVDVMIPEREMVESIVDQSLWLLPGVRDRVGEILRTSGVSRISDLRGHVRFGAAARRICRCLENGDARRLMWLTAARGGAAHPLNLAVASMYTPSDILFLDIETGGLFGGSPIVVVGLASVGWRDKSLDDSVVADGKVVVRILAATTPDGERELVARTVAEIENHPVLVTFNGRSFDLPYVAQRAAFYGNPLTIEPIHLDLLGYSRRIWRGSTTDCRLSTLAREILGLGREEDVPGALVPVFYEQYLQNPEEKAALLAAVAIHNCYDMEETVRLYNEHIRRFALLAGVPPETGEL